MLEKTNSLLTFSIINKNKIIEKLMFNIFYIEKRDI